MDKLNLFKNFSILIVTKNDLNRLIITLNSIRPILLDINEIIIQDSMSIDGTQDYVKSNFPTIKYFKEPDIGIYDGMNKGVDKILTSNFVLMLNCGDEIILKSNESYYIKSEELFNTSFYTDTILIGRNLTTSLWVGDHTRLNKFMSVNHQSIFINVSLFKQINGFSLSYKIASDYNFLRQYLINGFILKKIPNRTICKFQSFDGYSEIYRSKLEFETACIRYKYDKNVFYYLVHILRYIKFKLTNG